jgi:hypothetical protein
MIEGIGIDVVNIDRMAKLSSGALSRLFHSDELATALSISSGVSSARNQYLAGGTPPRKRWERRWDVACSASLRWISTRPMTPTKTVHHRVRGSETHGRGKEDSSFHLPRQSGGHRRCPAPGRL